MAADGAKYRARHDEPLVRFTFGLFVASGAAGLVDQIAFSKYLSYVVGSTAHAVSAVLASFMVGLALGAALAGRFVGRVSRPLVAYGVLEILVGATVVLAPAAFDALTPWYVAKARQFPDSLVALSAMRWSLASLVVVVPTMAMGATLPLLSALVRIGRGEVDARLREQRLGALYAANTLGGAMGSLGTAYFVLPALGLASTLHAAAATSAAVGVAAIVLGRDARVDRGPLASGSAPVQRAAAPLDAAWMLGILAFASGGLVFACEVVFTHLLSLVIGNSVYAFGLILAVFLSCLFVGATRAPAWHARLGDAALPLGFGAAALGITLTLKLWDLTPFVYSAFGGISSFAGREAIRALVAFLLLVGPTTLMGLTFPLLLQRVASRDDAPRLVGRLTSINTIGAVCGSLATGYLVLPALGSERTILAVAAVFALGAVATASTAGALRRRVLVLAAAAVAAGVLIPGWNLARLTSGTNVYFTKYRAPEAILFVREDVHGGVTTVVKKKGVTRLETNGKFQGDDGPQMDAQRMFAHYPTLFVQGFDRALVIGIGTATTVGTITAYPWKHVEVVDISPAIVEAADRFFAGPNRGALRDPRVRVVIADGRNHLLLSETRYDLISMELSSIWFAGAASLYSREYYQLVKSRLSDVGVFQQWVQFHHVTPEVFATILNSLRAEFRHVALFYGGRQGMIVATDARPLTASRAHLAELQADPRIREVLPDQRGLLGLFDDVLAAGPGIDAFLDDVARRAGRERASLVSTDDNLFLDYATPKGNVLPWETREALVEDVKRFRRAEDVAALLR